MSKIGLILLLSYVFCASVYAQGSRLQRLKSGDPDTQTIALHELRQSGQITEDEASVLAELILKGHSVARETNRVLKSPTVISLIEKALSDSDPTIRSRAAEVLGDLGKYAKGTVSELKKALSASEPSVRRSAAQALRNLGVHAQDALPELKKALSDSDREVGFLAAKALGNLGVLARDIIPDLKKALSHSDGSIRARAAHALERLGGQAKYAVPELKKALSDSDREVRLWAVQALGNLGVYAKEAVPELVKIALSDSVGGVRFMAIEALGRLGVHAKNSVPELRKALSDSNPKARSRAAEVLKNLGLHAKEAVPELRKALLDSDREVRRWAAHALVGLRIHAKDAVPELKKALSDSDPKVRTRAAEALEKMNEQLKELPVRGDLTVCEALKKLFENKDWQTLRGHNSENHAPLDAWDTAMFSLQQNLLTKGLFGPTGECQATLNNDLDDLQGFAKSLMSLLERTREGRDPLFNGVDIYAKIYRLGLSQKLERNKEAKEIRTSLERDLVVFRGTGIGGSVFNTYAYGAALVALAPKVPRRILKRAQNFLSSQSDPMALPYTPTGESRPTSRQASSARNVPFHLALYLSGSDESTRKNMLESIEIWQKYAGNLAAEVPKQGTHRGPHGLAPYYFYSSLPYVTSAIKVLLKDPELTVKQREQITKIRESLRQKLPSLMSEEGKIEVQGQGKSMYSSSPAYNYPLYGLALVSLLDEQDRCFHPGLKEDFGIVVLK